MRCEHIAAVTNVKPETSAQVLHRRVHDVFHRLSKGGRPWVAEHVLYQQFVSVGTAKRHGEQFTIHRKDGTVIETRTYARMPLAS